MKKMYPLLVWLALLLPQLTSAQTTYYISPGGDDANNGTSPATAWKTVAPVKANNYAVLTPGTAVLFERGQTHFVDNIRPVASGTAASPVVFGAYGTGDNPVLTGAVTVTGFTDVGGGVYSAPLSSTAVVRLVFRDEQRQPIARHPNDGFFYTTSIPANTTANANMTKQSFIDNARTEPTGYWVGATVGIRFDDWEWYSNTVTAYDGTTKQFMLNGVANNSLRAGWGYFFTNKREILDAPGEWYQNGATLFYMPPAGVDPSTLTLQAANVANAFNFQNVSYFRVENLSLEKYASNAVSSGISAPNTTRNDGLQFQNVRTVFSYGTGISLNSASNARIENCQVLDAQYEGINVQNCTGTELLNTAIRRTGLVPGLQYRAGGGIIVRSVSSTAQGSNNHIANCVIDSSGKHGIRLEESLITVEKTVIKNSALNSSDIGGIYLISATCQNVTLRQNFISDTKSYTGGLPPNAINLAATQKGRGLYVDDFAQDILMEDNTSYNNSSFGIHLINGKNVTLRRNLTFGNGVAEVNFQENNGRTPRIPIGSSKHTVQDNVFIATDPTGTVVRQEVQEYNGADFGLFSNNFYHHPFTKEVYMLSVPRNIPATPLVSPPASASAFRSSALLTVPEFQAFTGAQPPLSVSTATGVIVVPASGAQDLNSRRSKFRFRQFDVTGTLSGNLITNGTFETGTGGWNNESATDFTLSQKDELNGKTLSYQSRGTLVNRKAFTFNTVLDPALFGVGSYFQLKFTAKATKPYATLQPYFAQNSGSFTSSVFAREVATRPVAEDTDLIFPVSSPLLPSSVLKFAASIDAGEYFVDDVSLQKVSVTPNDRYRQLLLANPSDTPKTFDVAGLAGNAYPFAFFDKDSVQIGSSVTVPAWSSQVVFAIAASTNPASFAITAVTGVSCTTLASDKRRVTFTPQYAGLTGQPVSFSVVNELAPTTAPGPYSLNLYTDNPTITLRAMQNGTADAATYSFNWLAACNSGTPTGSFAITAVTGVSCVTLTANQRRVTFTPQYAGLTGQPVSFSVVNELSPTRAPGPYALSLYADNPTITLKAVQQGSPDAATYAFDWLAACRSGARTGAEEPASQLQVRLLGNPVGEQVVVEITGVGGQLVRVQLTNTNGQTLESRVIEQAASPERQVFDLRRQAVGMVLLRISTNRQTQYVKIIKQ